MNYGNLRTLLHDATRDVVADADVAATAWDRARKAARRRKRMFTVTTVAAMAAVVVTLVALPHDNSQPSIGGPPTTGNPSSTGVTDNGSYLDQLRPVVQPTWHESTYLQLPLLDTSLPPTLQPDGPTVETLAADPIRSAVAVAQLRDPSIQLRVLGDDQRWRRLDVPGLAVIPADCCAGDVITGRPLSPDGSKLAIGQPHGVVIVDLTTGDAQDIDVPGMDVKPGQSPVMQWTPDGAQVTVGVSTPHLAPQTGWIVDSSTGEVRPVPYDPVDTGFAPDGTALELANWDCGLCEIRRYHGIQPSGHVRLGVGLYESMPAIDHAVAVSRAVRGWSPPRGADEQDGLLVIDPSTGAPLAQLPLESDVTAENATMYGWLDADTLVFGVDGRLVAWNYHSGQLSRLTDEPFARDLVIGLAVAAL